MSVGHCGNGCDWDPLKDIYVTDGCRKTGCWCGRFGPCSKDWNWRYTLHALRCKLDQLRRMFTGEFPCMSKDCGQLATRGTVETLAVAYCDEHMDRYLQGRYGYWEELGIQGHGKITTLPILEYMWSCPPWPHDRHAGCDYRTLLLSRGRLL